MYYFDRNKLEISKCKVTYLSIKFIFKFNPRDSFTFFRVVTNSVLKGIWSKESYSSGTCKITKSSCLVDNETYSFSENMIESSLNIDMYSLKGAILHNKKSSYTCDSFSNDIFLVIFSTSIDWPPFCFSTSLPTRKIPFGVTTKSRLNCFNPYI